jgi:hypothetical protein
MCISTLSWIERGRDGEPGSPSRVTETPRSRVSFASTMLPNPVAIETIALA